MPIRILPSEVASQIAAGEVIERPASVVKELIENSLDARASFISIEIKDAGRSLIEVADDGSGIPAEELPLAVERHATSKLREATDLFQIETLGFRGEALASIGSVARMTVTSRASETQIGGRLLVEGGRVYPVQPAGAPFGTVVRVENLFFNVPARLKFLKTDPTERRLIENLVTRYALANPGVRFHLKQEERKSLQTSGKGGRREILAALYGAETASQMLEVLYRDDFLAVTGHISPTAINRTHRREIFFFVNGRPVQDPALISSLMKGYSTLLMVGRYPLAALFLEIASEYVDVNVHPTKAEVRFRENDRIYTGVQSAVRRALLAYNPVPVLEGGSFWNRQPKWGGAAGQIDLAWELHRPIDAGQPVGEPDIAVPAPDAITQPLESMTLGGQHTFSEPHTPVLRPVGQVALTYLVAEGPDGLYLIDQHAAHERVLFERFMEQRESQIASQTLLQPQTLELNAIRARLLEQLLPVLNTLGFQVEPFGPNTFLVRSIPDLLSASDPAVGLRSLVENFEEDETPLQGQIEARLIARICKRSAVKAGATLSSDEQRNLLLDLERCQSPRTCPHGRPTMIHLSVDLLERQFGRRGAR